MPYRSKKKRRLYAAKWRAAHPDYARAYNMAYYYDQPPTCLLGRRLHSDIAPHAPVISLSPRKRKRTRKAHAPVVT